MTHDLRRLLADSDLATSTDRPDLGSLWCTGRNRRRRRRAASAAAAVVVVGLLVGGVALARPGDRQHVEVTGLEATTTTATTTSRPGSRSIELGDSPAAEPRGPAPTVVARASGDAELAGRAIVGPASDFTVEYPGALGWERGAAARWQAWDGRTWTTTHQVVSPGDGELPSVAGATDELPARWLPVVSSSTYRAPSVGTGWYRVCVDLRDVDVEAVERCTQVVVPSGVAVPSAPQLAPPDAAAPDEERVHPEPHLEATVRESQRFSGRLAIRAGEGFEVVVVGGEAWQRAEGARWERWDGGAWVGTTILRSPGDDDAPRTTAEVGGATISLVPGELRPTYTVPDDQPPGWYRLCLLLVGRDTSDVAGLDIDRCVQLVVPEG